MLSRAQPSFIGVKVKYTPETAASLGAYTAIAPGQSVGIKQSREWLQCLQHSLR